MNVDIYDLCQPATQAQNDYFDRVKTNLDEIKALHHNTDLITACSSSDDALDDLASAVKKYKEMMTKTFYTAEEAANDLLNDLSDAETIHYEDVESSAFG